MVVANPDLVGGGQPAWFVHSPLVCPSGLIQASHFIS